MRALNWIILFPTILVFTSCNTDEDDSGPELNDDSSAIRYHVEFDATWSMESHPNMFPGNAHFSGLIGTTHKVGVHLFELNELASPGIRSMAETGSKTLLRSEIESSMASGDADFLIDGPGVGNSPGKAIIEIELNASHPFITITSMIAPSPDWFIAVSNVNLYDGNNWAEELEIEVRAYDAGTDSGSTYSSPNEVTNPVQPILEITDGPLESFGTVPVLGTIKFIRIE